LAITHAPITILLVEDNPGDVFLVRRALQKHGLQVDLVVAEDGQAGLMLIDRVDSDESFACPALALLDLNLPRATGSRVLARIRQSRRCATIPIIIVTSSDSSLDREAAARLGATSYFQKPGDLAGFMELGSVVRNALGENNGAGGPPARTPESGTPSLAR
jgi:DNA-binding response OmpR family regulator